VHASAPQLPSASGSGGHATLPRPHQGLENELLMQPKRDRRRKLPIEPTTISLTEIRCEQQLGGLLKSHSRRAA
jgi:hypothetical protein